MKQLLTLVIIYIILSVFYSCSNNSVKADNPITKAVTSLKEKQTIEKQKFLTHIINPKRQDLKLYWKTSNGNRYGNFKNLKDSLVKQNKKLTFAMNAGMFQKDYSPLGLYIENGKTLKKTNNIKKAYGNFYLQPNGIFYLSNNNEPTICKTTVFQQNDSIKYATQSGPMLVIDGKIHPKFNKESTSIHYRNGVGILPNNNLLFVMSNEKVNFYTFAAYFKNQGCKNALYLDGFVSKTYLPSKNVNELGGNFGVIIGETQPLTK